MSEGSKLVLLALAAAAFVTVGVLAVPQWLGAAAGPEVEILTTLKNAEAKGLSLDVGPGQPLVSTRVNFQRVSVAVEGERAVVTATLDFDGKVGGTAVSSLGLERVPFRLHDGSWVPGEGFAPQLVGVVRTLERRRAALERGEVVALCAGADAGGAVGGALAELFAVQGRKLKATAWLIRSERDGVMVSEDYRLSGVLPERPVDELGARRLRLTRDERGDLCFPDGVM